MLLLFFNLNKGEMNYIYSELHINNIYEVSYE